MNKLLLVDGSNLLFQMFFGMPARIVNAEGKAIHGTLGFVGALLKIIRMTSPTHVAVIFDSEHDNQRTQIDPDYKRNRPDYTQVEDADSPFSQLSDIYAALDYLRIKYTETVDCETDDLIASYALTCGKTTEIIISSFDSDFFQLVTDHVFVLRYRGEKTVICDMAYISNKFGIYPEQYPDFKSLTGDTADNIRGAKMVGPKTAAELLAQFGSLENILANTEKINKMIVRQSVSDNKERLLCNYSLIKLNGSHKLPFEFNDLKWEYSGQTTNQVLQQIGLK